MFPLKLDGKEYALKCEKELKNKVKLLNNKPKLVIVIVGNDSSSLTYVNMKTKKCFDIGIDTEVVHLDEQITTKEVINVINKYNNNSEVTGIMIQHPMPKHIEENECFNAINVNKDIDGLNTTTFGNLAIGKPMYYSATPLAIIDLLKYYKIKLSWKHIVVVGRSRILGKPLAMMLLNENVTVTICHSYTKNIKKITQTADILIAATGKPFFIKPSWLKSGVILVDAGYKNGKGDIDPKCYSKSKAYTPVPGGIGPVTIIKLVTQAVK